MMGSLPPSYLALLLLAVYAEGVLAVDDVDEMIAVIIFAVLIVIFALIALFFLIMIIRLKREQREVSDSRKRRQRDIVRINTERGLKTYTEKHDPSRLRTLSEGSTNTNPSTVTNYTFNHQTSEEPLLSSATGTFRQNSNGAFNNPVFSAQLSQTSEITITTNTVDAVLPTVYESHDPTDASHDPSTSPPDYYQLYKKPSSTSDVTKTVSFSSEETEQLSASPEIEKQPLPPAEAAEHNGAPPQIHSTVDNSITLDHASLANEKQPHPPTETLNHNGLPMHTHDHVMHNGDHVMKRDVDPDQPINNITNGAAGVGVATTANNTMDEKTRETISSGTKRKGLKRLLFGKEKPRRNSQKPLLTSQSSTVTTPGDSPPRLKVSGTADLPDTFYEEDENGEENTITMNADGMYIAPIEETSL